MPFWFPSRFRSFALSRSPVGAFRADVMGGLMACRWLQVVLLRRGGVRGRGVADAGEEGVGGFDGDGPGGVRAAGGGGIGSAAEYAHPPALPEAQDRAAAVAGDGRCLQAQ